MIESQEAQEHKLKEFLIDVHQDTLDQFISEYEEVVKYCAEQRIKNKGNKGLYGKGTGMLKNPSGTAGARHIFSIPPSLKKVMELWSGDRYFWKDKKNVKKYFPELFCVDPNTV